MSENTTKGWMDKITNPDRPMPDCELVEAMAALLADDHLLPKGLPVEFEVERRAFVEYVRTSHARRRRAEQAELDAAIADAGSKLVNADLFKGDWTDIVRRLIQAAEPFARREGR